MRRPAGTRGDASEPTSADARNHLWLPAAFLQIRMKRLAQRALDEGTDLPEAFHQANRIWLALGVPAFTIALAVIYMMVTKWIPYP